jgi:hypothetical protein
VRRPTVLAALAALLLLAAAPAFAAKGAESRIRRRLAAAVQRTETAKSVRARAVADLQGPHGKSAPFLRIEELTEGTTDFDARRFQPRGTWASDPTNEVIAVGNRGWYRGKATRYHEVTIVQGIEMGFGHELAGFGRAVAAATDLKALGPNRYELTAPASTINEPENAHRTVRLVLSIHAGHLSKVRRIEGDAFLRLLFAESFTDYGHSFAIAPPPADQIAAGPAKEITSQEEFSELLGPPPFQQQRSAAQG